MIKSKVVALMLNCNLTIKRRPWYWGSLLHSQRWWVHDIWCFVTTLQLVCFQLSLHYHLNQNRHFWQKQQMTIFALSCFPTSSLRFFVFLKWFALSLFFTLLHKCIDVNEMEEKSLLIGKLFPSKIHLNKNNTRSPAQTFAWQSHIENTNSSWFQI